MRTTLAIVVIGLAVLAAAPQVRSETYWTLGIKVTRDGQALQDPSHGRFYVYDPEDRDQYLAWGHGAKPVRLREGVYDVVVRYENDHVRAERVLKGLQLVGDVERVVDFAIEIAEIVVHVTAEGVPIEPYSGRYSLYAAGRRGKPLASKRPGTPLVVRRGVYDIEVVYHDAEGMRSKWLHEVELSGRHEQTVDVGPIPANLRVGGEMPAGPLPSIGIAASTPAPPAPEPEAPVAPPASEPKILPKSASLRVEIRDGDRLLRDAWFAVYPAGRRTASVATASSNREVGLDDGTYDIGCFLAEGSVRPEKWLNAQRIVGRQAFSVDMAIRRVGLRVRPPRGVRPPERRSVLVVVDSSIDMAEQPGRMARMEVLRDALPRALETLEGTGVQIGLRAYGIAPRSANDCRDSALLAPLGQVSASRCGATLDLLRPAGFSPIAFSLEQAARDLPAGGSNTIVLLTGSAESCHGSPCAVGASLVKSGVVDRVYVVTLGLNDQRQRDLRCAGLQRDAGSAQELTEVLRGIFREVSDRREGTVSVFRRNWSEWIASAALDERIELVAGVYDVLIRTKGRTHTWEDVTIDREMKRKAGPRP